MYTYRLANGIHVYLYTKNYEQFVLVMITIDQIIKIKSMMSFLFSWFSFLQTHSDMTGLPSTMTTLKFACRL